MSAVWEDNWMAEAPSDGSEAWLREDEGWLHEDETSEVEDETALELGHEVVTPSGEVLGTPGAAGQLWVPGAERVANPRSPGGTYVGGPWRFVFHTMEARPSATRFRNLAARHRQPPHLWAMPAADLLLQTIPLDRSAFALARPGSVHTNRRQAVQVEIWGFAKDMASAPPDVLEWLARRLLAPVARIVPIDLSNVRPAGTERCYGVHSSCRMSAEEWRRFNGVCGHKDVPDNAHWDPGGLDMAGVAARARAQLAGSVRAREDGVSIAEAPRTVFSWPMEPERPDESQRVPSTPWAEEWAAETPADLSAGWTGADETAGAFEFTGDEQGHVVGDEHWEASWRDGEAWSDGEASWEGPDGSALSPVGPTLRRGSTGADIAALQRALTDLGHPLTADGSFGARTEQAVRAFQGGAGLTVDGVVGPATRARLVAAAGVEGRPGAGVGAPSGAGVPAALGTLTLRAPGRTFAYRFTPEDLVWTAKLLVHEAGGHDDPGNAAVLWAMFNRYALFTHTVFRTFSSFVRAYSTTLQPVLLSKGAAARHAHKPPTEYVRTGGFYPVDRSPRGQQIPRGQLRKHLDIQAAPWDSVKPSARALATRALSGRLPNPGIGLASEFASTLVYWQQQNRRTDRPSADEWRRFTMAHAAAKKWRWIGDVPGIDQMNNAFFLDLRAASLPADSVQVVAPGVSALKTEWESPWRDDVRGPTEEDWQDEQDVSPLAALDEATDVADDGYSAFAHESALEDAGSFETEDPRAYESPPERAKNTILAQARRWGTDEAAVIAALRLLRPSEVAELQGDPAVVDTLRDELSGADLAAAAAELARGRVGTVAQADVDRIVAAPARHRLGTLAAALTRDVLLRHHEAFDRTGTGTIHGNKCRTPPPAGTTASDCTTYVLDVAARAFGAKGRAGDWMAVLHEARTTSGPGGLKGTEVMRSLQNRLGWEALFWSPDPRNPADGSPQHSAAYQKVHASGTYYGIRVQRDKSVIGYRRTNPARPNDLSGIERLRRLQFGILDARGGTHMALVVNGAVYEVHWNEPATNRNAVEATPLEGFAWLSGAIVAPQGEIGLAWRTP